MFQSKKRIIIIVISVIFLFILASYLSREYASELEGFIKVRSPFGELIFIGFMAGAVVVAPFETLPVLPLAVGAWGPNLAAFYAVIGWTAGALVAFAIARLYGPAVVCRLVHKCDIEEMRIAPRKNIFWFLVLARILLPVDIVSYGVGLFTRVPWTTYLAATVVGVTPFVIIFAYGARLPIGAQAALAAVAALIFLAKYDKLKIFFTKIFK